ncbi:MAG TPA: cytochrome P460 family protein [Gemmatimonadales bacterium]|nr:cytochrome P460 family protein [Gemmatimonadales bacterium]
MRVRWQGVLAVGAVLAALAAGRTGGVPANAGSGPGGPRYVGDSLVRPEGIERWVLAGASLGLGYRERSGADAAGVADALFHNVYIEPSAYAAFAGTGRFPEGTMLALALHRPRRNVAPSRQGLFEGDRIAVELAVKDRARHPGGWAYFDFGDAPAGARAAPLPRQACERCHAEHAADDHVFVQFYPTLRPHSAAFGRRIP